MQECTRLSRAERALHLRLADARAERDHWKAQAERWAARVKVLERRARAAIDTLEGRTDD